MILEINPISVALCEAATEECEALASERSLPRNTSARSTIGPLAVSRLRHVPGIPRRMTMSPSDRITRGSMKRRLCCVLVLVLLGASHFVSGQVPITPVPAKSDAGQHTPFAADGPAAASLEEYLKRVRQDNQDVRSASGSIWTDTGRLTRMSTDVRAMRPHDLISVVVSENLAASTDGTVKSSRASNASSGLSGLIGTLHAGNALQNLVNQTSASGLNAQGTSATNSSLTTTFGGQVVEVLPNGMLVIEAARQVEFSQQTETIILRGLVRPEDISQQNQVLSTAISSMELQVRGKGIVNDYTHRQNALVRLLQRALVF